MLKTWERVVVHVSKIISFLAAAHTKQSESRPTTSTQDKLSLCTGYLIVCSLCNELWIWQCTSSSSWLETSSNNNIGQQWQWTHSTSKAWVIIRASPFWLACRVLASLSYTLHLHSHWHPHHCNHSCHSHSFIHPTYSTFHNRLFVRFIYCMLLCCLPVDCCCMASLSSPSLQ